MDSIFQYIFQSFLSFACLYLIYFILLKNETFFRLNRYYLLISAVISLLIPFAKFEFAQTVSQNSISYLLDTVEFADNKIENLLPVHFQLSNILLYIYLIGVTFYTTKFLYQFYRIYKMISKFQVVKSNGLKLVFTNSEYLNFLPNL